MNSRTRFQKTMQFNNPDRPPLFEDGVREGVLEHWKTQGFLTNIALSDLFTFDSRSEIELNLDDELDLVKLAQESDGLAHLEKEMAREESKHLPEEFFQEKFLKQKRDSILMLQVHDGFFLTLGVQDWKTFSKYMYLLMDEPIFVREALKMYGEFAARLTEKVLQKIEIDAAIFSEPIGGDHGSLISLDMYRKFVAHSYIPIIDTLNRNGVKTIIARTYANTRTILPALFDIGINCIWACETNPVWMDYQKIRCDFGKEIRLIGGIDLDILRQDKKQIQEEMERIIPPLLEQGGYIPLADGRVREDILFEKYFFYRNTLERMVGIKS